MDNNFNHDNMQPQGNERDFSNQFAQYNQPRNAENGNETGNNPYQPQQPVQPGYNQTQPQQPVQPGYNQTQPQQPVQPGYNQVQPQQPVQPAYNQYQQPYDYNAANPSVYNAPANGPTGAAKAFSIVSLICGILSMITFCYGIIFGIPGLIFALVAKAKFKGKNTMALLGLIFSIVGIVLSIVWFIVLIVVYNEPWHSYYRYY